MGDREQLRLGEDEMCDVPTDVATCPECSGAMIVMSHSWDVDGRPQLVSLEFFCDNDGFRHHYHQSTWQPVINKVRSWVGEYYQ